MLSLKNVVAGYNGTQVLRGVDFTADVGEIVAIIGPNGSGKSTLLKSIFNLCTIYSGTITFKDKDITRLPTFELIEEGISFVPQGRQVFSDLSVKENLEMGAYTLADKELVQTNLRDVFKKFPFLKEKQNEYAFTLSGGQQQMLAIARALVQDPEMILFDEPSLGLSPIAMKETFAKIKEINKEGITAIIVEQNAKQAVQLAHHTYVLEQGKVALHGDASILSNKKIQSVYFGGE